MKFRFTLLIAVCAITALSLNARGGLHDLMDKYGLEKRTIFIEREAAENQDGYRHNSDWVWYVNSKGELRADPWTPYLNTGTSRPEEKFDVLNAFEYPETFPGDGCLSYVRYAYGTQPTPTDNQGYEVNDGFTHARGYILEADAWLGEDIVLTTNSDGWHPGQRAWSGNYFPWANLRIRAWNDYGEDVVITPVIELIGIDENGQDGRPQYWTVPSGTPLTPNGHNAGYEFDSFHADGSVYNLWATADSLTGYPVMGLRITLKGSAVDGTKIEIYGMGIYSHWMDNYSSTHGLINREYRIGSSYMLPWYEYDMGGRDEAYHSSEFLQNSNQAYNFNRPYRLDQDSVNALGIDAGYDIGDWRFTGSACYTNQIFSAWSKLTDLGWADKEVVTKKEAQDFFGTWYEYTFSVPEDCEADINIATFANYGDARIIESGWGSNGPRGQIEGIGNTVWPKRYAQAYVLELDGKAIKTNQTSYPEMIHDNAVLFGGHTSESFQAAAYTADEFFSDIVPDQTKWRSTLLPDGTANDTLFTWSYQNLGNQFTPGIPKYSTDASLGNQYQNIHLKEGVHVLRVNKLMRLNNGFRGLTFDIHAKTSDWTDDVKMGDVNGDGNIDVSDVVALANYVMGSAPEDFVIEAANINGTDGIDVADVVILAGQVMGN